MKSRSGMRRSSTTSKMTPGASSAVGPVDCCAGAAGAPGCGGGAVLGIGFTEPPSVVVCAPPPAAPPSQTSPASAAATPMRFVAPIAISILLPMIVAAQDTARPGVGNNAAAGVYRDGVTPAEA